MRSLRRVVRTPPGPRFHAVGDRPVAFTQAEAPPRLPGRLAMAAESDRAGRHGRRGADAFSGRLGAGRITAGDADPGAQRGESDGGDLALPPGSPVTRTDFPAMSPAMGGP